MQSKKPCDLQKIETSQGFSILYKEHLLYSKYNPKKNILSIIENLQILPGSILLCCSPLLAYGLSELLQKLPENCLLVLCEAEQELFDFSKEEGIFDFKDERIIFCPPDKLNNLPLLLYDHAASGFYKRVIRIDMSAGIQFHKDFYDRLYTACSDSVMTFWKNRITLTRFGRRYSKNLFENLSYLGASKPINAFFSSITKPILVFGAGQSTETFLSKNIISPDEYFILCADTALTPLLKHGVKVDGVFIEEAQAVILKAFTGCLKDIRIFAALSSIPNLARQAGTEHLSYFFTEYTKADFISDLKSKSFITAVNKPFGSVGLTAVYYALKFRKDESIPVYVCGLDFSYSPGLTHTKGALANILRLIGANKLLPSQNYNAAFSNGAFPVLDKNGRTFITTPTLQSYAQMFNNFFAGSKNLFDAGESGLPLAIEKSKPDSHDKNLEMTVKIRDENYSTEDKREIENYLENEKKALEYLKSLLTGKTELRGNELIKEIQKIAAPREYLYLHFPDGWRFSTDQSFLNRIRTEIDFFLKYL